MTTIMSGNIDLRDLYGADRGAPVAEAAIVDTRLAAAGVMVARAGTAAGVVAGISAAATCGWCCSR